MKIEELALSMRVNTTKDVYSDRMIEGRRGNIHEDGKGFSIFIGLNNRAPMDRAHDSLSKFCERRQNGDTEGVYFSRLSNLTRDQIKTLVRLLKIRQKRQYSPEVLEKMRANGRLLAKSAIKMA